jgi:NAD(P)-dependent dehydrogenase (short-subunit alcohol dehydrogenase family)
MAARRIAIVTGGNRGIGHEIARQLIGNDVHVVIGCRDAAKCEHAVAALKMEGPNVSGFTLDVVDTHSVRRFVDHVLKEHGAPSILVNNAGVYPEAPMRASWIRRPRSGARRSRPTSSAPCAFAGTSSRTWKSCATGAS